MKTESGTQPKPYRISVVGQDAHIEFAENIQSVKTDDGTKYTYDSYLLTVKYTANLAERVEKTFDAWINKAKAQECVKPSPTISERISAIETENSRLVEENAALKARLAKVEAVPLMQTELAKAPITKG